MLLITSSSSSPRLFIIIFKVRLIRRNGRTFAKLYIIKLQSNISRIFLQTSLQFVFFPYLYIYTRTSNPTFLSCVCVGPSSHLTRSALSPTRPPDKAVAREPTTRMSWATRAEYLTALYLRTGTQEVKRVSGGTTQRW